MGVAPPMTETRSSRSKPGGGGGIMFISRFITRMIDKPTNPYWPLLQCFENLFCNCCVLIGHQSLVYRDPHLALKLFQVRGFLAPMRDKFI